MKLAPDEQPWIDVAQRVIDGEFSGADSSTVKSLTIGLRSIDNPACKEALKKLEKLQEKKKKAKQSPEPDLP